MRVKRRPGNYNQKRKIRHIKEVDIEKCRQLARRVRYGGNPEHKRNPGDFNLTPSASPRSAKSLCDTVEIFEKRTALEYLKEGLKKGMISISEKNGWPQNIWALDENGWPMEAQLENQETGTYHGYPLPESDPFAQKVAEEWKKR